MTTKTVLLTGKKIRWNGSNGEFEFYACPSYPPVDEIGHDQDGEIWIRTLGCSLNHEGFAEGTAYCTKPNSLLIEHNDAWLTLDAFVDAMKNGEPEKTLLGRRIEITAGLYKGRFGTLVAEPSYPPANPDGSDRDGDFWVDVDDHKRRECLSRDAFKFVDEIVERLVDEVLAEEKAAFIVRGSYGDLYLDAAGNVERYVDADGDNEYGYITKFDLTTLSGREVDIISTGYWTKDGEYVKP